MICMNIYGNGHNDVGLDLASENSCVDLISKQRMYTITLLYRQSVSFSFISLNHDTEPLNHDTYFRHIDNFLPIQKNLSDIHCNGVIMGAIAVFSTVYLDTDQRKHQSSASLAFVRGIHRRPVNSTHKRPVTQKMLPFNDVIMYITDRKWLVTLSVSLTLCHQSFTSRRMWIQFCRFCPGTAPFNIRIRYDWSSRACWTILGWIPLHGPLTRYAKFRAAHATGMPGKFSPPPTSNETAS